MMSTQGDMLKSGALGNMALVLNPICLFAIADKCSILTKAPHQYHTIGYFALFKCSPASNQTHPPRQNTAISNRKTSAFPEWV